MKANCKALYLSITICSIAFLLILLFSSFVLKFENKPFEIILNIFIGIFGSSCVALLLAIPAYNVSKRQLLEKYRQEAEKLIKKFSDIEFLFNEYSDKLVVDYINELRNKKWQEEYSKICNNKNIKYYQKYKDMLIEEFIKNRPDLERQVSKEALQQHANDLVDKHIEKIRNKGKKICKQYIEISKETTTELTFMLGDMQFFLGKKPYIKIYYNIYMPLLEMLNRIKEEVIHIQLFLDGEGSEAVAIDTIFAFQKELFDVEIKETADDKTLMVYNKFLDKMLLNLEVFRADMYGIKPEKINIYPVASRTYNKKVI